MPLTLQATDTLNAALVFSDGDFFLGHGIGICGQTEGEICFNTGLTGYQETLTDPSYAGQIITFTFPHIGNVGTNAEDNEASKPFCRGVVVREAITAPSNFRSQQSLSDWLIAHKLVGISGVDTRALTQNVRNKGARHVQITHVKPGETLDIAALQKQVAGTKDLNGVELTQSVTTHNPYSWTEHTFKLGQAAFQKQTGFDYHVVAIDYGIKHNILRLLVDAGFKVTVVASTASFDEILALKPDGVFLSNGPGDPAETGKFAIPVIRGILAKNIPLFGICLGHQLLGLAAGLKTQKMQKGHRGANQPVQDLTTGRVFITSQNHGFSVLPSTDLKDVEITHVSLFDRTVEGLRLTSKPAFSVQFHPESSPGPHDTRELFDAFKTLIASHKKEA
ncbi:MAG: glutamine-hydrolyzing carbamoyl-phosphate synthase small subunit [Candidatus Margulisiibacteriota bacterium]